MNIVVNSLKFLLGCGMDVNFKRLSICRIERGLADKRKVQYQVESNYKAMVFSHLYDDMDIAIDKFMLVFNMMNQE